MSIMALLSSSNNAVFKLVGDNVYTCFVFIENNIGIDHVGYH